MTTPATTAPAAPAPAPAPAAPAAPLPAPLPPAPAPLPAAPAPLPAAPAALPAAPAALPAAPAALPAAPLPAPVDNDTRLMPELTKEEEELFYNSMIRITDGLPSHELQLIQKESIECEAALQKEIEILEAAIKAQDENAAVTGSNTATSTSPSISTLTDQNQPENPAVAPAAAPVISISPIPIIPPEYDATNLTVNNYLPTADKIIASDLSPLDRYFTVSALLGRLREPFDTPPPPHSGLARVRFNALAALEKKKNKNQLSASQTRKNLSVDKYTKMLNLKLQVPELNNIYAQKQENNAAMLALVKRISNHRTAAVFRRAVNPLEAPGYTDRILFPIDLTMIKKMVLCEYIQTFEDLYQHIGLICHNCVKFNGRDSDYSMLTREFENYVDDSFIDFMQKQKDKATAAAVAAGTDGV